MSRLTEGALAGVRVADFSRVLAGPYATMTLADFGADVVKVESPGGDETRAWRPPIDARGEATYFSGVNRNKRSLVCDLKSDEGRRRALDLVTKADVVVENFRPGVMDSFGLDYGNVARLNPSIVYCSITGFGAAAGANLPGYDLLVQAVGGLMSITGPVDGEPTKAGVALVDIITGLNAVVGILIALRERERTGAGQRVEVNLLTSLLAALSNQASSTLALGRAPHRHGNAHPSIAPYELYPAADRELVIAVGNDRQFRTLVRLLDAPALADDPRFVTNEVRVANRLALRDELVPLLSTGRAEQWVAILLDAGVPAGLVNDIAEAFDLAGALGLDPVAEMSDTAGRTSRQVASPIRLSRSGAEYELMPPLLGEHQASDWR